MLQVEEEVMEENLKKSIFSVINVRSMDIMQVNVDEARKKIKKVMQELQNTKKKRCFRWSQ